MLYINDILFSLAFLVCLFVYCVCVLMLVGRPAFDGPRLTGSPLCVSVGPTVFHCIVLFTANKSLSLSLSLSLSVSDSVASAADCH